MTFSKDGATCYSSDENGNPTVWYEAAYLERSNGGYLVYRCRHDVVLSGNIVDGCMDYSVYLYTAFLLACFRMTSNTFKE